MFTTRYFGYLSKEPELSLGRVFDNSSSLIFSLNQIIYVIRRSGLKLEKVCHQKFVLHTSVVALIPTPTYVLTT